MSALPNHYGELTPASRRGVGSGNNFAKHNPAGPHSFTSVQVRRQIGKGCDSGERRNQGVRPGGAQKRV